MTIKFSIIMLATCVLACPSSFADGSPADSKLGPVPSQSTASAQHAAKTTTASGVKKIGHGQASSSSKSTHTHTTTVTTTNRWRK